MSKEDKDQEMLETERAEGPEEQGRAEALAGALNGGDAQEAEVAELVRTAERVRAAAGLSPPLSDERRGALVENALKHAVPPRRPRILVVSSVLAAAVVLFVVGALIINLEKTEPSIEISEAFTSPTDDLFEGPFPEEQSPSARLDRIVEARTRGYFSALILSRSGDVPASREPRMAQMELKALSGRKR